MLTAAAPGQTGAYLIVVARQIAESREERAVREARTELVTHGAVHALAVITQHVRTEDQ